MATALSQAIADAYQKWRSNPTASTPGTLYTGTVSELVAGDFLYGSRTLVTATGATTSGVRTLTVSRLGQTGTVAWPSTQVVYFER